MRKKWEFFWAAALGMWLFMLFASGCNNRSDEKNAVKKPSAQYLDKSRIERKLEWLKLTEDVVRKINCKEADEVFHFLKQSMIAASPNIRGFVFLEAAKTKNWIAIVPLLDADKNLSEDWNSLLEKPAVAHFLSEQRAIVVRDDVPFSSVGKALVLLHEGYHAYLFVKNPYTEQDNREYSYEEVKAHAFQNKVMLLLGGKKYQAILDREVARISDEAKKSGEEIGSVFSYDPNSNPEMASVFGEPQSPMEKFFTRTSVWIHANFVFLEKNFKGDVEDQKAVFMRAVYEDAGVLPVR